MIFMLREKLNEIGYLQGEIERIMKENGYERYDLFCRAKEWMLDFPRGVATFNRTTGNVFWITEYINEETGNPLHYEFSFEEFERMVRHV